MKKDYNVPAVEKALNIIEALSEATTSLRITDLSEQLELSKTTILATLSTLEKYGYVSKLDNKYKLTNKFSTLISKGTGLINVSETYMEQLAKDLRFTVHLSILKDQENVLLYKVNGPGFIQFNTFLGKKQVLHATSSGKAIMTYLTPELLDEILDGYEFTAFTKNTISSRSMLEDELKITLKNGYAVEDEEEELGIRCVGAPIFNANQEVVGAISVTATCLELEKEDIPVVGKKILSVAKEISHDLGWKDTKLVNN